jgi:hypothetical protein
MKAVGYKRALPIDEPEPLLDVTLPEPEPHRATCSSRSRRSLLIPLTTRCARRQIHPQVKSKCSAGMLPALSATSAATLLFFALATKFGMPAPLPGRAPTPKDTWSTSASSERAR